MSEIRVAIHGAGGRMGRRLVALGTDDPALKVVAALESNRHPDAGRDAGEVAGISQLGISLTDELTATADCLIDFSVAEATDHVVDVCQQHRLPLVIATTGLDETRQVRIRSLAEAVPVVWAPNMSLAVNLTMKLVEQAATALCDCSGGADVEIIERHHRFKEDAPSGTALRFGEIIAESMKQTQHTHGRQGMVGQRPRDEIGYHALRVGDDPGQHTIVFGMLGETIELSVRATNRDCYALGALQAAQYVVKQPPGIYSMYDVLGL